MNIITNPVKAIKAKCMDCCCGSTKEVQICPCTDCALWPFRSGKNPYRKKIELSDEQMEVRLLLAKFPRSLLSKELPKVMWILALKWQKTGAGMVSLTVPAPVLFMFLYIISPQRLKTHKKPQLVW